jgi:3-oxoacyl-[acyl-carrier protein] reductase
LADTPRTVLITGASRGIGRAAALRLAAAGHRIGINYRSHGDEAEDLKKQIESDGGTAFVIQADVSDKVQVKTMISATIEALGPIEIMINNAGIIDDTLFMRMKDDQFERVMQTNTFGTYYCSRAVIAPMVSARWGRIINVTSVVGLRGNAGQVNYSASKGAIHTFTYSLAKEVAKRNVTINAVAPGYVETATVNDLPESLKAEVMGRIFANRFGQPDEIAAAIAFIASEDAAYINGEVLRVDGGLAI